MKNLHPLLFALLTTSAISVFASHFTQPQSHHTVNDNAMYDSHKKAENYYEEIQAIAKMPQRMMTTDITPRVQLARTIQKHIEDGANMFDEEIQDFSKKLYVDGKNEIKDTHEQEAYRNARIHDLYTPTNLVELEQQRIQQEQQELQIQAATELEQQQNEKKETPTGCNCIIN